MVGESGLTRTTSGAVGQQGTGKNCVLERGEAYSVQRERRNDRSVEVRNLNVGTMTGKGRMLAGYIVQRMLIMDLPGGEKRKNTGTNRGCSEGGHAKSCFDEGKS